MGDNFDPSKISWETDEDDDFLENHDDNKHSEFAKLIDENLADTEEQSIKIGKKVTGIITSIGANTGDVLVDLGVKRVGVLSREEIEKEPGEVNMQIGAPLTAIVSSINDSEILLTLSMTAALKSKEDLLNAWRNKLTVKAKVLSDNKGGFEVGIFGKKAFCPFSAMETRGIKDKSSYIGKEFDFIITEMRGKHNIVVSRIAALRLLQASRIKEVENEIATDPNKIFSGHITDVRDFGVFVDIGDGLEGLVYRNELSWSRVDKVEDEFRVNDLVRVKILNISREGDNVKLSLSMKSASQDPWESVEDELDQSKTYNGKVIKLEKFGAFVEVIPGIEGLIHISEMSWVKRIRHPSEILKIGDQVKVRVISLDVQEKKLSLSMKSIEDDPWFEAEKKYTPGKAFDAKVERLKHFGAILSIKSGVSGLLPISIMQKAYGQSYKKNFQIGSTVKVIIDDLSDNKILFKLPNVEDDIDSKENYKAYLEEEKKKAAVKEDESIGDFGRLLKKQLDSK